MEEVILILVGVAAVLLVPPIILSRKIGKLGEKLDEMQAAWRAAEYGKRDGRKAEATGSIASRPTVSERGERVQQSAAPATEEIAKPAIKPTKVPQHLPPPVPRSAPERGQLLSNEGDKPTARAAAKQEPRKVSKIEQATREALTKIWNWIIVGEEHRPKGVSTEYAVAVQWLLRVGVVLFLCGLGFLVKLSIESGLLGPAGRVALSGVFGVAAVVVGLRLLAGKYALLGHGIAGIGFAALYFVGYGLKAFSLAPLLVVLLFAVLLTATAGAVAARFRSLLIALIGLLGGYAAAWFLRGESTGNLVLFVYLTILAGGVLWLSWLRGWRVLYYLSFLGHYFLYFELGWRDKPIAGLGWDYAFLTVSFLLFSGAGVIYHLRTKLKVNFLDIGFLALNAGVFFYAIHVLMARQVDPRWLAAVAVALSIFYSLLVARFLKLKLVDRGLCLSLCALSLFFIGIALPIALDGQNLTVAWSIFAFLLLWLGTKLGSQFFRMVALGLYGVVLVRIFEGDLGSAYYAHKDGSFIVYLQGLLRRLPLLVVPVASFFGAAKILAKGEMQDGVVTSENDIALGKIRLPRAGVFLIIGAVLFAIIASHELYAVLEVLWRPAYESALTLLWIGLALLFFYLWRRNPLPMYLACMLVVFAMLCVKTVGVDLFLWQNNYVGDMAKPAIYTSKPYFLFALTRLVNYGSLVGVLVYLWRTLRSGGGVKILQLASTMLGVAVGVAFIFLSFELYTFCGRFATGFQQGAISLLWAIFALAFLFFGIKNNVKMLRLLGLILFSIVTVKIIMFDLDKLSQIYRVIAFLALGPLIIAGSYFYLRSRTKFEANTE